MTPCQRERETMPKNYGTPNSIHPSAGYSPQPWPDKSPVKAKEATKPVTVVTVSSLEKKFGPRALRVIPADCFKRVERTKKGERHKITVLKPLPSVEAFRQMEQDKYKVSVASLITDAYSEFESLGGELREWHDGMPENLQNGSKAEEVEEAASVLENFSEPDVPEAVNGLEMVFLPGTEVSSRSARCCEAVGMLQKAIEAIESKWDLEGSDAEMPSDVENLLEQLKQEVDEAEGVEFPGMF